ncbi:unnamed protein product [Lymnaea stagnalis]|uniref:Uncharacterized protein n=1 Tax=Lymnaea stagnalis TaxID=6523 RepID=A0AAV2GY14_LYMST
MRELAVRNDYVRTHAKDFCQDKIAAKHREPTMNGGVGDSAEADGESKKTGVVRTNEVVVPRMAVYGNRYPKPKLIIHLDIRNTMLVADSFTNVSVEEALNSFLTGVVWGSENNGEWAWHSQVPSLKPPGKGLCTYYKFLEKKLVKNPTDRVKLRLQTGDFVHRPDGRQFQEHFDTHLARLLWDYDTETSRDKVLTMSGKDGQPYHYILPSVYKLILHLAERKRDFAIVIRTYGRDAPNVLSSLKYGLRGNHPAFRRSLNIKVHANPGVIKRDAVNFELINYKPTGGQDVQQKLVHERDIYRALCASHGISGYVDDFHFWQVNNYDHGAGKPFWLDLGDRRHHHIFFDDNFRADDEDSIVDVRLFTKENNTTAVSLGHDEVARLEDVCLVQADLLSSINDEDYFIRMTNKCEENYFSLIQSGNF